MAAGANNMAGVALATASAGIIVGCVSLGLGQQITSFVEALSMGNIFLMILITAVASLLLGMGLPTTANYIIMASLTAPVIVTLATWSDTAWSRNCDSADCRPSVLPVLRHPGRRHTSCRSGRLRGCRNCKSEPDLRRCSGLPLRYSYSHHPGLLPVQLRHSSDRY